MKSLTHNDLSSFNPDIEFNTNILANKKYEFYGQTQHFR